MTTTGLDVFDKAVQKTNLWLKDLQRILPGADRKRAFAALFAVLRALRDRLTADEAFQLGAQLPMILRGFYFEDWEADRPPSRERTLDHFLARVAEGLTEFPGASPEPATRAVFQLLADHVPGGEIDDVCGRLPRAVRDLWPAPRPSPAGAPVPARAGKRQRSRGRKARKEIRSAIARARARGVKEEDLPVLISRRNMRKAERKRARRALPPWYEREETERQWGGRGHVGPRPVTRGPRPSLGLFARFSASLPAKFRRFVASLFPLQPSPASAAGRRRGRRRPLRLPDDEDLGAAGGIGADVDLTGVPGHPSLLPFAAARDRDAGAPGLREADGDRLLGAPGAVLAAPDVVDLLVDELASRGRGRVAPVDLLPGRFRDFRPAPPADPLVAGASLLLSGHGNLLQRVARRLIPGTRSALRPSASARIPANLPGRCPVKGDGKRKESTFRGVQDPQFGPVCASRAAVRKTGGVPPSAARPGLGLCRWSLGAREQPSRRGSVRPGAE